MNKKERTYLEDRFQGLYRQTSWDCWEPEKLEQLKERLEELTIAMDVFGFSYLDKVTLRNEVLRVTYPTIYKRYQKITDAMSSISGSNVIFTYPLDLSLKDVKNRIDDYDYDNGYNNLMVLYVELEHEINYVKASRLKLEQQIAVMTGRS